MKLRKGIGILPREVLLLIFSFLDFHDKYNVALVCKLWREVAETKSLWKEVFLDYKQKIFKRKVRPSLRAFFHRYTGFPLEYLVMRYADNDLLRHLQQSCPNLDMLVLEDGDYTQCDFSLLPSSLGYLEISVCDPKHRNFYPHNWFESFTPEHFPKLTTLKFEGAPNWNEAIVQFTKLKTLDSIHIIDVEDITAPAFDALMTMSQLQELGLVMVNDLPRDYASKIVQNLRSLQEFDMRLTINLVERKDLRQLARLSDLRRLMLRSQKRTMNALIRVICKMSSLEQVEFDFDFQCGNEPGPSKLIEMLAKLQELRPDVDFKFRDVEVSRINYEYIKEEVCEGEETEGKRKKMRRIVRRRMVLITKMTTKVKEEMRKMLVSL
ncbi:F-box/LRR-repeat protein 12-like [Amphiura filiformis]|uniref:F-box/LRR-repeat protein 12-like n=1 Tax=Amphiura filiformis TaxID=82378 RepID=UPI003B216E4F